MTGVDVAIIGGGPAGSTVGCLLKKYHPALNVAIFEREVFPRDHVGESLLPPISPILAEMGCWDKVEAANFPIKIGATLRWGKNPELWDFEFFPAESFKDEPRPAKFEGQRRLTAFQVDRAVYDEILLRHAEESGCEVRQGTKVSRVLRDGDRVTALELDTGETVTARHYVDASGNSGILRRALDVRCDYPSTLQNIAIWDYWQNAEWAVKIGVGATRIQVRSLAYGWLWFIPLGPTRTSLGLVIPAEHFKKLGKRPEEVYQEALQEDAEVAALLKNATRENHLQTTKDWSFIAEKQAGENWFLVGECAGFADPILSAGVSMAHIGAQQAAYTILEIDRKTVDPSWLKEQFSRRQKRRISTHISFADYWYVANAQFKDLKEFTAELARDNGLELTPEKAWRWLAQGGFIDEDLTVGAGGFNLLSIRSSTDFLTSLATDSPLEEKNVLKLDLEGAIAQDGAAYQEGRVLKVPCYVRGSKVLPLRAHFGVLFQLLQRESRLPQIVDQMNQMAKQFANDPVAMTFLGMLPEAMEGMIRDGWIKASFDPRLPRARLGQSGAGFQLNRDTNKA
ncbi:MAG TPA: NAD(P)/FAD-dependent oxidoreductase [Fimbriimonas sp.]|nr:NAD(P)/FAD-dependent oxidoreductase [Fimbriimonas sp.]